MIQKLWNILPDWVGTRRDILGKDFSHHGPIVVYQMGGVGSSTAYESLVHSGMPNPVFHVHYLCRQGIRAAEAFHKTLADPAIPHELRLSETLRRKMRRDSETQWYIITLMRDPVARGISSFFHNAWTHYQDIFDGRGQINPDKALSSLIRFFSGEGRENLEYQWFEDEFKPALGMDVCSQPFDREKGYGLLEKGCFRVLVLRLEDMNHVFSQGVTLLLNLDSFLDFSLVRSNQAKERDYFPAYVRVKENFRLPLRVLEDIYSNKYVRHFYSGDEIAAFMERWSE